MKIKYLKDRCVECGKKNPCAIIYGYQVTENVRLKGNWPVCIRCLTRLAEDELYK